MTKKTILLASVLTAMLAACGQQEPATPEVAVEAAPAPVAAEAPAKSSGGGYEPSESERVPGITMTQEELDKLYAEARANTPQPVIPGEEAAK